MIALPGPGGGKTIHGASGGHGLSALLGERVRDGRNAPPCAVWTNVRGRDTTARRRLPRLGSGGS